jgi:YVTN family beta-propeller protein
MALISTAKGAILSRAQRYVCSSRVERQPVESLDDWRMSMKDTFSGVAILCRRSGRSVIRLLIAGLLLVSVSTPVSIMAAAADYNVESPAAVGKVLPNDWHISPAGIQVTVGNLPTNGAITPDGHYLAVTNNGCSPKTQEISIVDLKAGKKVSNVSVASGFLGVAFSQNGRELYVSGGNAAKVYLFAFADGVLTPDGFIPVAGYPAGLALLPDGSLAVAENTDDKIALVDIRAGKVTAEIPVGRYPYWVTAAKDGKSLYASNWGSDSVSLIDLSTKKEVKQIKVGKLPEAMVLSADGGRLYVVNTNSDSVSVIDTATGKWVQTIDLSFKALPTGAAPTGLALSPSGDSLYVSLAGINADAVVDLHDNKIQGYVPAGWYPTAVFYNPEPNQIITLSGKGMGIGPNPDGPKPGTNAPNQSQYDYSMIAGVVSILPAPDAGQLAAMTRQVQNNALDDASRGIASNTAAKNPIPRYLGGHSPIKHVFFIVRENRTYDQILGDLRKANGDPSLVLFGRDVTPNAHELSERFVTMDNYYADAEVSVQGHAWTAGAYSNDYVEKNTALLYSGRYHHYDGGVVPITYPPNGYIWKELSAKQVAFKVFGENYYLHSGLYYALVDTIGADDPLTMDYYQFLRHVDGRNGTGIMGKFFDRFKAYAGHQSPAELQKLLADDAGFRNDLSTILTGSNALADRMAQNRQLLGAVAGYLSHYEFDYRGWDLKYSDLNRVMAFNREFDRQIRKKRVPSFSYIWLPNDHTAGLKEGYLTPSQLIAQNDRALGEIVETISHSPIWENSAIFVTEDDAQNGSDHVDAHRTVGLVISPYVKHGIVNHTHYDQASMLRTMELILDLTPMSMYDAAALPMYDIFIGRRDLEKYNAVQPKVSGFAAAQKNYPRLAAISAGLDLSQPDIESQDDVLNKILWESVKGTPYRPMTSEDDDQNEMRQE